MQSIEEAVNYFGGEELPATVWAEKYAARNLQSVRVEVSPTQMHRRLAKEFARIEKKKFKKPYSEDYLFSLFDKFSSVIPQGSPMAGIGVEQLVSLSNCFVVAPPTDSYGGIMRTDEQMVQLCKRRGGVGTDLSHIRPDDLPTSNSARKATGVVPFMRRYSNTIREVGQAGRRGALMLTLSVHHPQILDFARIKMNPDEVTGANVSVRLSDEFLSAVKAGTTYEQRWPVDSPTPQIRRQVDARTVWKEIITCAHARAEPGLLFWDHVLRDNPAECYADVGFGTVATNPCSEIPLSILDACRLLVVNLFTCVVDPFKKKANFDFLALYDLAYVAQRLMDDLVDLEIECIDRILKKIASDPESEEVKRTERELWEAVRTSVVNGRRTGLGPTALGDAIAAVGLKYGSDESVAFTEEVYKTLKLAAYRSSVDMAKELGAFPVWDADKERDCPFLLRIAEEDPKLYRDMQKYGRRNIAALTTAPVGSVSLLAKIGPYFGSCSGIEPLFNDKPYTRRKKINHAEVGARVDFVDPQGDRWTEFEVKHAGIKLWSDVTGETDWKKSPYHKCCAEDLDWKQRVKLQAAAQKHIDHAISSTINLPEEVSVEKVAEIYQAAWEQGCKGITVYRKNCRTGVLVDQPTAAAAAKRVKTAAPKRPKELKCEVHHTSVKGQPCVVLVGLLEDEPYEAFALLGGREPIFKCKSGTLAKEKRGHYRFGCEGGEWIDVTEQLSDEQAAVTRLVSTSLRHGVDTAFVVQQLEKVKGEFNGFAKAVARTLKKYIKDGTKVSGDKCDKCGSEHLVRQEGCVLCMECGHSKCN